MHDPGLDSLVTSLTQLPQMQRLWKVHDRGVPVFAHTIDVTLLALAEFRRLQDDYPKLNHRVITLGSLLHDLNKGSARETQYCHSWLMNNAPDLVAREAMETLAEARKLAGHEFLTKGEMNGIIHVVLSHHGRWGQVKPETPEAILVHECDLHSAMNHRLAPYDANDILPHLAKGRSITATAALLGIGKQVIKQRLRDACQAELVDEWESLLPIWERQGHVSTGNGRRKKQLDHVREIMRLSREVPDSLLETLAQL